MEINKMGYSLSIIQLNEEDGGGWLIEVPELPGCMSDGETIEEALRNIDEAISEWIDTARSLGRPIPQPRVKKSDDEYSGKFVVRIPKELHKALTERAEQEGISLNQLVNYLLTKNFYLEYQNRNQRAKVIERKDGIRFETIIQYTKEWSTNSSESKNPLFLERQQNRLGKDM